MKIKECIAFLLAVLLMGSLTACGNNNSSDTKSLASDTTAEANATDAGNSTEATPDDTAQIDGKVLIAYFAYSENMGDTSGMEVDAITSASLNRDTNNTEGNLQIMAQVIEERTGAEVFHILMTEPYPMDYSTMLPISIEQMENENWPALQEKIENLVDYDVVYLGVPVWNAVLPPAMHTFFAENDFSGKIIIPFGIHLGSRFGRMIDEMKELAPRAMVLDGFTINAETANDEVKAQFGEWLDGQLSD